jgi:hypothetical protein
VPFWFDLERLEGGDVFEAKIRKNIRACTLFLPMISRNTEDKNPRFFKREWNWALDRANDYLPDDPLSCPSSWTISQRLLRGFPIAS